ncbi:MAG: dockerin type I domain-containing protein [Porcipelethomonas sp.]
MNRIKFRKYLLSISAAVLTAHSMVFPAAAYSENTKSPVPDKFVFGEDNWQFINSSSCFGGSYFLTDSDRRALEDNLSNTELHMADMMRDLGFFGACYGMAALSVLACSDMINYSDFTEGASSVYTMTDLESQREKIPESIASLCNYYFFLQCTNEVIQYTAKSMINMSESERLQGLIDNAEKEIPQLLTYTGSTSSGMRYGHAVVAVSAEYGDYEETVYTSSGDQDIAEEEVRKYNGRIRIYDNAALETEERYLYFNTEDMSWYYNGVSSENGGLLSMITSDTALLNNKGLIGGTEYKNDGDFIALLYSDPVVPESSVSKISYDNGKWKTAQSTEGEIRDFPIFLGEETSPFPKHYTLTDAESGYVMDIEEPTALNLNINYENTFMETTASAGSQAVFHPSGYTEITGENTDYTFELVFNDGYYNGSWYDLAVTGTAGNASVRKTDEGYIIISDGMEGTEISASGDGLSASCSITDAENSLLIYEINERTIGLASDTDGDGIYENKKTVTIFGDANEDGIFNVRDAAFIAEKLAKGDSESLPEISDYNDDGAVNIRDGASIARYLAMKK